MGETMLEEEVSFDNDEYWKEKIQKAEELNWNPFTTDEGIIKYFEHCLRKGNRFFFNHPLIPIIIKNFEKHSITIHKGERLYRARIDEKGVFAKQAWDAYRYETNNNLIEQNKNNADLVRWFEDENEEIRNQEGHRQFCEREATGFEGYDAIGSGAPPMEKASSGRCNPENVVFLYASNNPETAVAEIRPYRKDSISIATLVTNRDLKLVDFYYEFDEKGKVIVKDELQNLMKKAFSRVNKGNKEEYLVTQYLTSLAENEGFDGIRFRSSLVENGMNYVIFNPENCTVISSEVVILNNVTYDLFWILREARKGDAP